ncbi:c-type cytochrome [Rhizorhapis sp. SPR117]|uniref:c-type cytochrome n=1 Tax=Rhizorhapis sp. SPR117 TaxID=2912611 RepID=UPI001F1F64A7|nr:cytochrome c family protein [Rhizorhapis sp. SPR117]
MDRQGWKIAWTAAAGAVLVIWSGEWFAGQLVPTTYPGELAFGGADEMPPAVDLAAVQRDWPGSLGGPGEQGRLIAYVGNIERQKPPVTAVPARATTPQPQEADLGTLLASADAAVGKGKARVCTSCHSMDAGGRNGVGPALWGVVGRNIASHGGFAYSPALSAQPGAWTYERLDSYLTSPARAIPGNKMAFAGLRRDEDRAAVIKYLASLSPGAPAFPAPMTSAAGQGAGAQ